MTLTPYLMFNGNCEEALNFYAKALGGEIQGLMRFEGSPAENMNADGNKVLHATFVVKGNTLFMASDTGQGGATAHNSGIAHLSLDFKDSGQMENVFAKLNDGGTATMELQDTFWGARFGMITDRFGVNWMFNYDKPQS